MKKIIFLLLMFPFLSLAGEKSWSIKEIKSILIQVENLKLQFQEKQSSSYHLTWKGKLSFKNEKGQLHIQSQNFSSKNSWSDSKTKVEIILSGPSLPVSIFASFSEITFSLWKSPVFISSFNGRIKMENTSSDWNISLQEGHIDTFKHRGLLKLRSVQTDLNLTESEGTFDLQINEGKLNLIKTKGKLVFNSNKLFVHLKFFEGDIKGFTHFGQVIASAKPNEVNIQTREALIRFYVMGQGPQVEAYTQTGFIYAPKYLNKRFRGKSVKVSGRIRSTLNKKGNINLKTETGKIYIN
ncbi:MAG: hypothetical protein GDA46_06525 [Bdellovibrionales bacterium]|nr:hypothetical protein [Bdellovibrionales bacterium]